jgi:hypothetical protein
MLERIRTFFGRAKDKSTIVAKGSAWYCNYCKLLFLTKQAGNKHTCEYRFQDSIVRIGKDAATKE